jgi:hypothetical protein
MQLSDGLHLFPSATRLDLDDGWAHGKNVKHTSLCVTNRYLKFVVPAEVDRGYGWVSPGVLHAIWVLADHGEDTRKTDLTMCRQTEHPGLGSSGQSR